MNAASPSSTISTQDAGIGLRLPITCDPPSEINPPKQAVWLIFGATGHIGRSLVRSALAHGDKVTAVGKLHETPLEQMSNWHEHCQGLLCDVRVRETVEATMKSAIKHWSRIDIVVMVGQCRPPSVTRRVQLKPGIGLVAAAEDQTADDLSNQFETNFTGTLHIIQLSLPYFRENEIPGRYLIFSSTAGALGVPGLAPYCATKYAVEGLIESMLYEVDCFKIKATLVEPGYLRLDDEDDVDTDKAVALAAKGETTAARQTQRRRSQIPLLTSAKLQVFSHFRIAQHASPAYASPTSPSAHAKRTFIWFDRRQPTSAVRSAELVWQLGHCAYPPLRLLLGNYAIESIRDRLRCVIEEIEDWKILHFPPRDAAAADAGFLPPFPGSAHAAAGVNGDDSDDENADDDDDEAEQYGDDCDEDMDMADDDE